MIEDINFLECGRFTKRDSVINNYAKKFSRDNLCEISQKIRSLKRVDGLPFRSRTASEILSSGIVSGCTDQALVFLTLVRELGIPAAYVETLRNDWLESPNQPVLGHIFAELFIGGRWKHYDPSSDFSEGYIHVGREYVEIGRGLDFSEIYLKDPQTGIYKPLPVSLDSVERITEFGRDFCRKN